MFCKRFLFGEKTGAFDGTTVHKNMLYHPGKGYGFVTEQNRREQELLRIPELNASFDAMYWYKGENLTVLQEDENSCYIDSDEKVLQLAKESEETRLEQPRRIPLIFKTTVPRQGNYRITVTIRSKRSLGEVLIYTGRRHLAYHGQIGAGEFTCTMMVNVCDIVPAFHTEVYADTTVDLAILAACPKISELKVEEASCPTIYLTGDSTVTDQPGDYPYDPGTCYCGWGQMLPAYFNTDLAISNHSHSGLTTESFRTEGHYAVIEQYSKPGDYMFFQFGHNDQKRPELQAESGYRANLKRYIEETQQKGAFPVLVTPIARNTWRLRDQKYLDLLEEFAAVCLELGQEYGIPVLDLHGHSMKYVLEKGLQETKPIFFPGDYTHTNDYGAYQMAGYIAEEIKRTCSEQKERGYRLLAECVTEGCGEWVPLQCSCLPVKPAKYNDIPDPQGNPVLLSEKEQLERVVRLCLKEDLL